MQIALSTVCLTDLNWREVFRTAAESGYTAVELLMIPGWVHIQPGKVPATEVRDEAARLGLAIIALHAGGLDGTSEQTIASAVAYIEQVREFAREAGVPLVNFNGGLTNTGVPREPVLQRIRHALERADEKLAGRGVRYTVENHFGYQLETVADYRAVFGSYRHVGITLDTGHFTSAKVNMPEFIREFGSRIFHVHVKDHIDTQSVALGTGQTDNAGVIAALREIGYTGHLSVELELHDPAARLPAVQSALPYLRKLLA